MRTLPTWRLGYGWHGGAPDTLYAFVRPDGRVSVVRPGGASRGPERHHVVRLATLGEAREHWQDPLPACWRVA